MTSASGWDKYNPWRWFRRYTAIFLPSRFFSVIAGVSFLLGVVTIVLWKNGIEVINKRDQDFAMRLEANEKQLDATMQVQRTTSQYITNRTMTGRELADAIQVGARVNTLLADQLRLTGLRQLVPVSANLWIYPMALGAFGILPLCWTMRLPWVREQRISRLRKNLCIYCAYDLRATPDRCPECGAIQPEIEEVTFWFENSAKATAKPRRHTWSNAIFTFLIYFGCVLSVTSMQLKGQLGFVNSAFLMKASMALQGAAIVMVVVAKKRWPKLNT